MMIVHRTLVPFLLVISVFSQLSRCESEEHHSGQASFMEKQGLAAGEDIPDQIAIETKQSEQSVKYAPIPVPVPVQGFPGNLVLPLPPNGGHGGHQQFRIPPPPKGFHGQQQAQHSQHQQQHIPPPNFPQQPPPHFQAPPPPNFQNHKPQQHHQQQQQHQQHHQQQQQQHHSNEQIHPNHKPEPPRIYERPQGQQGPPKGPIFHQGKESPSHHMLRELIERQKKNQNGPQVNFKSQEYNGPPPSLNNVVPPRGPPNRPLANLHHPLKEHIANTNDLQAEGGEFPGPVVQYGGPLGPNPAGPWPEGPDGDMPKIASLEVKCEKNVMRVYIAFDKPFYGVIFSKGHYHNVHCIHLPAGLGHTSANFDIGIDSCGTQGNTENGLYGYGQQSGSGSFFENVVVIQYDSQVQEVWDQARKLRCTWHDQYEKSVTFRPFPVDMLDVVRADFAGDNVGCWMQIQVGKGPWATEVSGLVKIGQTMTMVLAIKDDDNKFDMLVRNCMAHDGNRAPIQLVDQWGCVTRPKLMSRFTKIKNFGASASVLSYAHFQAFKFPDSMEVHFQCTIQICRYQCPEQCVPQAEGAAAGGYDNVGKSGLPASREEAAAARRRRSLNDTSDEIYEFSTTFKSTIPSEDVGVNRVITVISEGDLDFISKKNSDEADEGVPVIEASIGDIVCMSTLGFTLMLFLLIGMLLIACIASAVIIIKRPRKY